ncbi:efflux RND transporter periplasmic adaptor subunit [Ottowia thiooxydans]|uniref:Multidrug efflux system membrane fusion protein n=1 Tax=Ottowia thiooxydans TaxID=219182 RepID=A0ABV2QG84_9BURK
MNSTINSHLRLRVAASSAAAMLLAMLTACGQAQGSKQEGASAEPPPASVNVSPVQAKKVQQWDTFNGRIAAQESVEIRPRVNGYIESVNFSEGQLVRKGQLLFTIDARSYKAALASAQSHLQRANAVVNLAKTQDVRARELLADRAISAEEADNRAGSLAQALANVSAAEAAVTSARLELGFTEVRSPITGLAGRALLTTGNLAQANQSVLSTVVSQNPVHVYFDADEQSFLRSRQAMRSTSGDRAAMAIRVGLANDEGFPHTGQVGFTDNRLDPQTGTISVRATMKNDHGLFTPGMFARVQMQGRTEFEAVLIDDKAVLTDQDRKYVYVVGENNRAERRELKLGRMFEGRRIVESGLEAGDQLVVAGMQRIYYPGMPIAPKVIADETPSASPKAQEKMALSGQR